MSSSRDRLDMMEDGGNKRHSSLTYTEKNGYYVRPKVAFCLLILFVTTVIAVALLVHYLAPCPAERSNASADLVGGGGGIDAGESGGSGTSTAVPAKPIVDVRLPLDLRPLHYAVSLQPYLIENNFTFDGEVKIEIECLKKTSTITLHILTMTIHEAETQVSAAPDSNKMITVTKHRYDGVRQFLLIDLRESLRPGEKYFVRLKFTGILNNNMAGFYRSYENTTGYLATTQFQPTDARRAFPCFDEPGLKAKFSITLIRPTTMRSLSNMPIKESIRRPDGEWVEDRFHETVNISTYLIAFVISNFENRTVLAGNNKTQFGVWARSTAIDQAQYALEIGPKILHNYETFFRTEYPLPKQDMIAIPDFSAGAMENWGLITYRETAMLYDKKISSASDKQRVAVVIAHELAHQWFGNLVTLDWWDDLWLNEGFASYVEFIGVDGVEPTWRMHDQFVVTDLQDVFELDSLETSHPVSVPVRNPDEINEIFDRISYGKGASIIRMMYYFLGENTFKKGLTNYLHDKKFKNAVQDDLWHHLTMAAKEDGKNVDVKFVMDTWTLQTGYPVVSAVRDYTGQTVTLTQQRFLLKNSTNKTQSQTKWEIPLTLATENTGFDNTLPSIWMKKNQDKLTMNAGQGIPSANQWIIFNVQETGYYRVNYDVKNWKMIIDQLNSNHLKIHPINRAQIIDDALDLARASIIPYDLAMGVTEYLVHEKDFIPWKASLYSLDYIDSMLSRSAAYGLWKKYLTRQLKPLYDSLGFKDNPDTDPHITQLTRAGIVQWGCYIEIPDCLSHATTLYRNWMNNNLTEAISPNQLRTVACMGIKYGGEKEWDFAWKKYRESNVGAEKDTLLSAMSCSYEPWILSRYLLKTIDDNAGIRKQDVRYIISRVAANKIGRYLALDFVRDKWMKFKNGFAGAFFMSSLVKGVMRGLNTDFELQQLKAFAELQKTNLGSANRAIHQMIEETESNVYWMDKNYESIFKWLQTVVPA